MEFHCGGDDIFLRPGDCRFVAEGTRMRTLLGSCISITLWHPELHLGGMCHYLLPGRARRPGAPIDGRYGDEAMYLLVQQVSAHKTSLQDYEAKLFGGGSMFDFRRADTGDEDIASRNVAQAHSLAKRYGLRVVATDLGGSGHRQLVFDIDNGDVWVRRANASSRIL